MVIAAFAALSLSVGQDDLREFEAACIQREISNVSAESLAVHRDQLAFNASRSAARETRYSLNSAALAPSLALSALSTCILRC